MNGRGALLLGVGLILTGVVAIGSSSFIAPAFASTVPINWATTTGGYARGGMMGGYGMAGGGMMGGYAGGGMMGGYGMAGGTWSQPSSAPGPGESGFVAGTTATPRVVRLYALPNDRFLPNTLTVKVGETITFEVTTMGPTSHEFMVGPAEDVATDTAGTPEITDLAMMQTKSLTYTFSGSGPFAFACHEPGHYEAGMTGAIVVQ